MAIGSEWLGDVKNCDICGRRILMTFVDGRTADGRWAIMCPRCRIEQGREKLGIGLGQKYERVGLSDKFVRVA